MKTTSLPFKKITIATSILSLFALSSNYNLTYAQQGELVSKMESTNAGVFSFEVENINYGTIKKGTNGEREFVFTNEGKEPIIITDIKKSCGCTIVEKPRLPILPGEQGVIKVKYDTKRLGSFRKQITVISNASESRKYLKISGNIIE
jgi:hypothetical protein